MITVSIWISLLLLVMMLFLSIVESSASFFSRVHLKILIEKHGKGGKLLRLIKDDHRGFLITLQLALQILLVLLSSLLTFILINWYGPRGFVAALTSLLALVVIFRQIIPRVLIVGNQDRFFLKMMPLLEPVYPLLRLMSWPILLCLDRARAEADPDEEEEEASDEEIRAYLGAGEEAGIFQRGESHLIQSALEFSNTIVRDIMTSRNEMVTVEESATMSKLKDVMVDSRHSRIPIVSHREDRILGIVYVKTFLGMLENGFEERTIAPLISEVMFVPETKKVSVLLKEMQAKAEHMAMVVNEYGAVSGMVTIEDLLEEIVGDIRDEDEYCQVELLREEDGVYFARGTLEIKELENALGNSFPEVSASTVSGLVVEQLGRIPSNGESILLNGVRFEVLHADDRRVHSLRILFHPTGGDQAAGR